VCFAAGECEEDVFEAQPKDSKKKYEAWVEIDYYWVRWLWWPAIVYIFWAMAYVCDIYFVRTVEVISNRFDIPDDVAGATLMALGCNGPELALNTISIFHPSNIGVGAVIGGEVFNLLVIIGAALLATPAEYMPLKLGLFSFFRDVIFYAVSVALLYHTLKDGVVCRADASWLLLGGATYIITVIYSQTVRDWVYLLKLHLFGKKLKNSASVGSNLNKASASSPVSDTDSEDPDAEKVRQWEKACISTDPMGQGSVLRVRVEFRNRMMDRNHKAEDRFIALDEDSLLVSCAIDPRITGKERSWAHTGQVYIPDKDVPQGHHWHHGGLINQPVFSGSKKDPSDPDLSAPLLQARPSELWACFKDEPWEVIPFEDIMWFERHRESAQFNLHVHTHDSERDNLTTLEFSSLSEAGPNGNVIVENWVQALKTRIIAQRHNNVNAPQESTRSKVLIEWLEWLQFPVKSLTSLTIPDMDRADNQKQWPVAFTMSMVWLAILAYCVVLACDEIHKEFGINQGVLGLTVAAAGTSLPNVFSGMCVARQGKTNMAVCNALGANVQNVFLALALPWSAQALFSSTGQFTVSVHGLVPAIIWIYVTLLLVVAVFLSCHCTFPRWSGGLFLVTYLFYVTISLGSETSNCSTWPFQCAAHK
ncbi:unnamed protein product, partial [Polarella glacialis]